MSEKYKAYNSAYARRLIGQNASRLSSNTASKQTSNSKNVLTPYEREKNRKLSNLQSKMKNLNANSGANFPFKTKTTTQTAATDSIKMLFHKPNSNMSSFHTNNLQTSGFNPEVTGFSQNSVNRDSSPTPNQGSWNAIHSRRVSNGYSPIDMAHNSGGNGIRNSLYARGTRNNHMMRSMTSTRTDKSSPERLVNIVCPSQSSVEKPSCIRRSQSVIRRARQSSLAKLPKVSKIPRKDLNYMSFQKSGKKNSISNISTENLYRKAQNRMITPIKHGVLSTSLIQQKTRSKSKPRKAVSVLQSATKMPKLTS